MAMTAADRLELQKSFVRIGDYEKDRVITNKRLDCIEDSQAKNDLVVVRIDTQLKIIMWLASIIVVAVVGMLVKMVFG